MLIFVGVGMCNQSLSWSVACMISCAKNVAQVDALYLVFVCFSSCVFPVRGCKYMHAFTPFYRANIFVVLIFVD